jgi:cytochrome c biogenesis protein CcmG/thiol:disulfide interchange protein DsbE
MTPNPAPPGAAKPWTGRLRAGALVAALAAILPHAPAQAADPLQGLDLSAYKGKVVYIDFWASWCGPCKLSFPYLQQMDAEYKKKGLQIIAVNVDHSRDSADKFVSQYGQHLNIVYDATRAVATRYKVSAMPTSIMIGRDGRVRYVHQGFFPEKIATYQAEISELLNEQ